MVGSNVRMSVIGCNITHNDAFYGALTLFDSHIDVQGTSITKNKAREWGGALSLWNTTSSMSQYCNVSANLANFGGGMCSMTLVIVLAVSSVAHCVSIHPSTLSTCFPCCSNASQMCALLMHDKHLEKLKTIKKASCRMVDEEFLTRNF